MGSVLYEGTFGNEKRIVFALKFCEDHATLPSYKSMERCSALVNYLYQIKKCVLCLILHDVF